MFHSVLEVRSGDISLLMLLRRVFLVRRDYRFFEADMIHPNGVAVDYIWDKLVGAMFSDEAVRTMFEVSKPRLGQRQRHISMLHSFILAYFQLDSVLIYGVSWGLSCGVVVCSTSPGWLSMLPVVCGWGVTLSDFARKREHDRQRWCL